MSYELDQAIGALLGTSSALEDSGGEAAMRLGRKLGDVAAQLRDRHETEIDRGTLSAVAETFAGLMRAALPS